jgi:arylsulfatase A-like enzyme
MREYWIGMALGVSLLFPWVSVAQENRPPNIVLIVADDLGYNDISLHGNTTLKTPHIDSIGAGGFRFTRAHATSSMCSPSRAGFLTGRNQQRFGFEFIVIPHGVRAAFDGTLSEDEEGHVFPEIASQDMVPLNQCGLPSSEVTIAEMLKAQGYGTSVFGKWHLGSAGDMHPMNQGFDEYVGFDAAAAKFAEDDDPNVVNARMTWDGIDNISWRSLTTRLFRGKTPFTPDKYMTDVFTDEAVRYIHEKKDDPFFLYMPYNAPHSPLQAPKKYYDRLGHIEDHKTRVYTAMIESMDDGIGRILEALKQNGLEENTLVIFTSDHGSASYTRIPDRNLPFRGYKSTYYQGGVVVPFLMRWPGQIEAGGVSDIPVSLLDLFPTLAATVNSPLPEDRPLDGHDIWPIIRGEQTGTLHEAIVWRSGKYKAIRVGNYRLQIDGTAKATYLYNVKEDIGETVNLASEMPDKVAELTEILDRAEQDFIDPAWPSPVYVRIPVDIESEDRSLDKDFVWFPL